MIALLHFAIAAAAYTSSAQGKPPEPETRPVFVFRDWKARAPHVQSDPRLLRCTPIPSGTACVFTDNRIGGVEARQIGAAFGRNGLFALEAKFPSASAEIIEAALRQRYGAPCEESTKRPFNIFGHKFENRIRVWCFTDGKATFRSIHGDDASEGSFEFATHDAARQASVQDF